MDEWEMAARAATASSEVVEPMAEAVVVEAAGAG